MVITCPECKKQLKGPAELAGKKIRCKACGHVFVVKGPAAATAGPERQPAQAKAAPAAQAKAAPPAKAKAADPPPRKETPPATHPEDVEGKNPYKLIDVDLGHRCPQCAADMEEGDIICLNCGYNTQTRVKTATKMTIENTPMEWFLWLTPGVVCAFTVLVMLGAIAFLWIYFDHHTEDGSPRQGIFFMKVYGSVTAAFIGWYCGRFSFKRLIKNYHPPEKELR
jgi:DNA-directed RNA polymerase subunit RPC12/RpoP